MTLFEIRTKYRQRLHSLYPKEEINSLFELAAENSLGMDRIILHQNLNKNTSLESQKKMEEVLKRLINSEPIQYILGVTEFYNLHLNVKPGVLIPRPETEYLVSIILEENKNKEGLTILDLCTGTACIALSLAKNLVGVNVTATDISEIALDLAMQNARKNQQQITFIHDDLLAPQSAYGQYDIIVSNPPYVRDSERSAMHPNVIDYEPHQALFVSDEDPLVFYKAIADFSGRFLKPGGKLYLEINQYLGEELCALFQTKGFTEVRNLKDLDGHSRFLTCNRPF